MECAVRAFKQNNAAWKDVKVIVIDKDFTELALLRDEFPCATIILCHFHIIDYLKRESAENQYNYKVKRVGFGYNHGYDKEMSMLAKLVTQHDCNLVEEQYRVSGRETYEISRDDNGSSLFTLSRLKSSAQYAVNLSDSSCSCTFSQTVLLPCRRVLFLRRHKTEFSLIIPCEMIPSRWLLTDEPLDGDADRFAATMQKFNIEDIETPPSHVLGHNEKHGSGDPTRRVGSVGEQATSVGEQVTSVGEQVTSIGEPSIGEPSIGEQDNSIRGQDNTLVDLTLTVSITCTYTKKVEFRYSTTVGRYHIYLGYRPFSLLDIDAMQELYYLKKKISDTRLLLRWLETKPETEAHTEIMERVPKLQMYAAFKSSIGETIVQFDDLTSFAGEKWLCDGSVFVSSLKAAEPWTEMKAQGRIKHVHVIDTVFLDFVDVEDRNRMLDTHQCVLSKVATNRVILIPVNIVVSIKHWCGAIVDYVSNVVWIYDPKARNDYLDAVEDILSLKIMPLIDNSYQLTIRRSSAWHQKDGHNCGQVVQNVSLGRLQHATG
ncbi:unnamed protein product [Phytophthora fragariaefolia]|uniref:Unnamed protein product n=1 Tax=Phytophthora fragariaefolia TaxID=1490495 RepID=A0A9W6X6A5_9STRA|nr:unnamed protein product [Phytophthora fragariaefolia]